MLASPQHNSVAAGLSNEGLDFYWCQRHVQWLYQELPDLGE